MTIERTKNDERQARVDAMLEEFRAAQQRRLVKRGIALWNRSEAAQLTMEGIEPSPSERVH